MKSRAISALILQFFFVIGHSQVSQLPDILPPSPEAAAINKGGQMSASLFTGAASASIPLYEVKLKDFSLPIALNYSSSGVKVDELPSRVGMGWNVAFTGVVSRILHGLPDDQTVRQQPPVNFPSSTTATNNYLENISMPLRGTAGLYETEPDEFRYNAPGLEGGKFILDDNDNPILIPYSNNKVEVVRRLLGGTNRFVAFIITNPSGIRYFFGDSTATERTISHNGFNAVTGTQYNTAFFLHKIESPTGAYIKFYYEPISISHVTGISQSITKDVEAPDCGTTPVSCGSPFASFVTSAEYSSMYLGAIASSAGDSLSFEYESRPDESQDNRLKKINIHRRIADAIYELSYADPATDGPLSDPMGNYSKRFFLTGIKHYSSDTTVEPQFYSFEYEDLTGLPPRLSFSQDEFGYYNGVQNTTLLPFQYTGGRSGFVSPYVTADRSPNFAMAVKGMLNKITYPTGGYEQFEYEANDTYGSHFQENNRTITVSSSGDESDNSITHVSDTFLVPYSRVATILFSTYANPGCLNCDSIPANSTLFARLELIDVTNSNAVVFSKIERDYEAINWSVNLENNHIYQLKVTGYRYAVGTSADLTYNLSSSIVSTNDPGFGVRVKSVRAYNAESKQFNNKFYKYVPLDRLNASSGFALTLTDYEEDLETANPCSSGVFEWKYCYGKKVSSNSNIPLYQFDNGNWGYSSVIESDDANFLHGGIAHLFTIDPRETRELVFGSSINSLPINIASDLNGREKETIYFNKYLTVLKRVINNFDIDDDTANVVYRAIVARKRNINIAGELPGGFDFLSNFDIGAYSYCSSWIKNYSTTTIEYREGITDTSVVVYHYGTAGNVQPAGVETTNSKGETITRIMKYPTDYPGDQVFIKMAANNIISPVIENTSYNGEDLLTKSVIAYSDWKPAGPNVVIAPSAVSEQRGQGSMEERLHYYNYDDMGNLLEVSRTNDAHISYIWDYLHTYPIAEIKNAIQADAAYTSFEADGKGNFSFTGTASNDAMAPTGTKSYNLAQAGGSISKSGLTTASEYIISYWSKSGSYTINGCSSNSVVQGKTIDGWTFYKHLVTTSASSITISGSGWIDEVRLYPTNALMTTFTYEPLLGVTSQCDNNNRITYYQYDGLGRLQVLRDQDKNIVKTIDYHYRSGN